jgi:hypothetical protein
VSKNSESLYFSVTGEFLYDYFMERGRFGEANDVWGETE